MKQSHISLESRMLYLYVACHQSMPIILSSPPCQNRSDCSALCSIPLLSHPRIPCHRAVTPSSYVAYGFDRSRGARYQIHPRHDGRSRARCGRVVSESDPIKLYAICLSAYCKSRSVLRQIQLDALSLRMSRRFTRAAEPVRVHLPGAQFDSTKT